MNASIRSSVHDSFDRISGVSQPTITEALSHAWLNAESKAQGSAAIVIQNATRSLIAIAKTKRLRAMKGSPVAKGGWLCSSSENLDSSFREKRPRAKAKPSVSVDFVMRLKRAEDIVSMRKQASVLIQQTYRRHVALKRFKNLVQAVVSLQSCCRGVKPRKLLWDRQRAASNIERKWSRWRDAAKTPQGTTVEVKALQLRKQRGRRGSHRRAAHFQSAGLPRRSVRLAPVTSLDDRASHRDYAPTHPNDYDSLVETDVARRALLSSEQDLKGLLSGPLMPGEGTVCVRRGIDRIRRLERRHEKLQAQQMEASKVIKEDVAGTLGGSEVTCNGHHDHV
eukprot:CAMPEP_0116569630 /NCGR_PEP_ID=MMETSP0397-20121206/16429_1 /TAXON_ID=216820 /ORGANISM="Cyclophora tenuis, Strain ECT3854" /LENGTH=336 /DNA_ID=CAMNT_0004097273 /DNA_START=159 /DNA_END=1169 /DNA_ORIENTATION=-